MPLGAPKNLTFELTEQQLSLSWAVLKEEELNGQLLAYKVQWNLGGENQVSYNSLLIKATPTNTCKIVVKMFLLLKGNL